MGERLHYRTCIVRAWREDITTSPATSWRLTLEVPALGLRRGFNSFQELADTMWRHLSAEEDGSLPAQTGNDDNSQL